VRADDNVGGASRVHPNTFLKLPRTSMIFQMSVNSLAPTFVFLKCEFKKVILPPTVSSQT